MNKCSNILCNIEYTNPIFFCYKCGSKSTNPKKFINGKPILKRMTHLYCNNCSSCLQNYGDNYCRDCGIRLDYNDKVERTLLSPKIEIKRYININFLNNKNFRENTLIISK